MTPPPETNKARSRSARPSGRPRDGAAAEEAPANRRRKRANVAAVALVAVAALGLLAWWVFRSDDTRPGQTATSGAAGSSLAAVSGLGAPQAPPWPIPDDTRARAAKAGLPLGAMGTAEHYHAHLDVLVDGAPVAVPANLGVDPVSGAMTYLHTHTPDGLLHIEAGTSGQPFTLGQLFTQWDVGLSATQLGSLRTGDGKTLRLYIDGKPAAGKPALARLRPHQQLTLVYGRADQKVDISGSYDFAPGE